MVARPGVAGSSPLCRTDASTATSPCAWYAAAARRSPYSPAPHPSLEPSH